MEIHRPEPVGDPNAVKHLSAVVFVGIEAALRVTPKGLRRVRTLRALGGLSPVLDALLPFFSIHATDPLPATPIYLVLTPDDLRLYAAEKPPYEIGRWPKRAYRASASASGRSLDLEVERLGKIHLDAPWRSSYAKDVFELAIRYAAGPAD